MALVEVTKKNNIAVITMNRPEALNALNKAVFAEFEAALDDVEKDNDVYVVIITGAGRAFIAGADIGEMAPMNVAEGLAFSELGNRILLRVDLMEKPTIAAVNGFALGGGCEMALACDIRLASEKAKLAIRRGMDCDISTAVSYEALAFATCFGTEDQKEGMQAFLEKRKEKHFKNA